MPWDFTEINGSLRLSSLRVTTAPEGEETRISLSGDFTSNSDFSPVLAVDADAIVFDLVNVERINSCGVREWIRLMSSLKVTDRRIAYERCSVPFVTQMNMIVNFSGGARVRSFYAPYLCGSCGAEYVELYEVPASNAVVLRDRSTCPTCGAASEFDDIRESYLNFLRR